MKSIILLAFILFSLFPGNLTTFIGFIPKYSPSSQYAIGVSSIGSSLLSISTNEVLGYVEVYSASSSSPFSLQFNAVIKAMNIYGEILNFWVQNILEFNEQELNFTDEIWNFTYSYASINPSLISGKGEVYSIGINNHIVSYYSYSTPYQSYSLPLNYILFISISYSSPYIYVNIGYGSLNNPTSTVYDTITIDVPNLENACIYVSPSYTGVGLPYSVELVWGGSGNGQSATFTNMESDLAIFYQIKPGLYSAFPIIYNYGFDTQESTSDLSAYLASDGLVEVSVGTPNPTLLTNYSAPLIPGWTEVTVLGNSTYSVDGYNFTYNSIKEYNDNFGLPYYISFTSPNAITVTIYPVKEQNGVLEPHEISVVEPYTSREYNTTSTTLTLSNNYFQIIVYYKLIPRKLYVCINIPMWGIVNGTPMLVKSGYYTYGTIIQLPLVNFTYINSLERYAFFPNYTEIVVIQNISIHVTEVLQYYIGITSQYPLYGYINNVKVKLYSNWFNESCVIKIPSQIYYVNTAIREILLNPTNILVNSPINYTAKWQTQYYINVNSTYPLYGVINNENVTLKSNWFNASEKIVISAQIYYVSSSQREVLLNPTDILVNSPINYTAKWQTQYFITVSFPVNATVEGESVTFSTGWYNASEKIVISQNLQYVGKYERVYIYNKTPIVIIVNSSLVVKINATVQFYVNFSMSILGEVNDSLELLKSDWYNMYTIIKLNSTYYKYISSNERVLYIPSITLINVTEPYNVSFKSITQYFLYFNSTYQLEGKINGTKVLLRSGWYNYSEIIVIPFQYKMINNYSRIALLNPENITVSESLTYIADWGTQYYLVVLSNHPVHALVNGTNTTLMSGWYNKFDKIIIENISYYVNDTVRYSIYNATLLSFRVTSPLTVSVNYESEYLVNINGKSFWLFNGSRVDLYVEAPFYYTVKWIGTYNVPNNYSIIVRSPITERAVYTINFINIISIGSLLLALISILTNIKRFKK
ncbi:hypothetical protein EWF20_14550 [Sulfolobus sp. S-194]|uniref:thermopsin family protease n=1 Tax=Sulfolobus sp. S-194 TaxID=2512240 RepID=UPI0014371B72|nr:thermopsin family protease [Sulfolobus sp. S-194]QIW25246.1 hypothetical protein EWF20_14550 [Sulfolobus sp. S-194]